MELDARVSLLLRTIDQGYDRKSWHGTTLRGSLRGVSAVEAAWRPASDRHNIWELAVHAAYWKYSVTRRLRGGERGSFPLDGSNWFPRPLGGDPDERAWKQDLALLGQMHRDLRSAVAGLTGADLDQVPEGAPRRSRTSSSAWRSTTSITRGRSSFSSGCEAPTPDLPAVLKDPAQYRSRTATWYCRGTLRELKELVLPKSGLRVKV